MSDSIGSKGVFPLTSGNVLYWFREEVPGKRGGIRASFKAEPSHRDIKEAKRYMASMVPSGATPIMGGEVQGSARTKSLLDAFMGRGSSN